MAVAIRTPGEIDAIAEAGGLVSDLIDGAFAALRPGDTPIDLADRLGRELRSTRARSAVLGFDDAGRRPPFPHVACVSVNDRFPTAIPDDRPIADGDLVTIDLSVELEGWHADAARTVALGAGSVELHEKLGFGERCLDGLIKTLVPGAAWASVASAFQDRVHAAGLFVVPGYGGHGIGRRLHEAPVLSFDPNAAPGFTLVPGVVVAIEPVFAATPTQEVACGDGWTSRAADGSPVWTEERTVAVTADGPRVLTPFGGSG